MLPMHQKWKLCNNFPNQKPSMLSKCSFGLNNNKWLTGVKDNKASFYKTKQNKSFWPLYFAMRDNCRQGINAAEFSKAIKDS